MHAKKIACDNYAINCFDFNFAWCLKASQKSISLNKRNHIILQFSGLDSVNFVNDCTVCSCCHTANCSRGCADSAPCISIPWITFCSVSFWPCKFWLREYFNWDRAYFWYHKYFLKYLSLYKIKTNSINVCREGKNRDTLCLLFLAL